MRQAWMVIGLLAGCGPGAGEITGSFIDHEMSELKAAYHGGPYLLLLSSDVDCIDTSWIEKNYGDAAPDGASVDFTALQFTFDGSDVLAGTFSVAGAAQARAFGLYHEGDSWDAVSGRDGVLNVTSVDDNHAEGEFDITFAQGNLTGTFTTDYCRNIDP
jgi:hypothetical protein